jgi:hypothetical protein
VQAQAGSSAVGQHMEGAWRVTITGETRPVELAFYHFTADGTVLVVGSPRTQSVAVGAWVRTGDRQFGLTQHRFNYDADGNLTSTIKVRSNIALNDAMDGFSGTYQADVVDLNGNVLRSGQGSLDAKRINCSAT